MSSSDKVPRTLNFGAFLELLRKIKKKLKLTALASQQNSLVLSQPVSQENKNSNVHNFLLELVFAQALYS